MLSRGDGLADPAITDPPAQHNWLPILFWATSKRLCPYCTECASSHGFKRTFRFHSKLRCIGWLLDVKATCCCLNNSRTDLPRQFHSLPRWDRIVCWLVGCWTSQQHASVSQGRICLTSQQDASVSQGRICLTSQQYASVSRGRICLTSQQDASVSQGRICLTSQQYASVSQGRICLTSQQYASVSQGRMLVRTATLRQKPQTKVCPLT